MYATEPTSTPGVEGVLKTAGEYRKMQLAQLKQMAENPATRSIVEQMAKANGCQNCEEFLKKIEGKLEMKNEG